MSPALSVGAIALSALLGVGVPWVGMAMLVPTLRDSERAAASNYRGWRVFYGLGVVWLFWSAAAIVAGIVAGAAVTNGTLLVVLALAGPLALAAFVLGLFDDAYGSSASRGFRGHLSALASGRLTTGGLKLFGISAASYVAALFLWNAAPWGGEGAWGWMSFLLALPAGAAIALTSNLLNLMDLRPGRALKVYSLLGILGVVSLVWGMAGTFSSGVGTALIDAACLMLFVLGPVLAVWRFDVREWGMLGDAGANPMGAVAGLLIVAGLPPLGLAIYLVLVFAANLVSEKVSFSKIIEGNAALAWLDRLGRLPETASGEPEQDQNRKSSHQSETPSE